MTTSDIAYTPILPQGWTRPHGFSHAVVATGTRSVRIAGQIGREPGQAQLSQKTENIGFRFPILRQMLGFQLISALVERHEKALSRQYFTDGGVDRVTVTRPDFSSENKFLSGRVDRGPFGTLERNQPISMA
jgi:hypothetical protein